jgi:hypothetical protein
MERRWKMRLFVMLAIWCFQWAINVQAQSATQTPTPTPNPFVAEDMFGRFRDDSEISTSPTGTVLGRYDQGSELVVISTNTQAGTYEVQMMVDGETGHIAMDEVELALPGSTATYREYAEGWCTATPTVARRTPGAGFFDRYQHQLLWADPVVLNEIGEFYLIFNEEPRDMAYQVDADENMIVLPASWILWISARSAFIPDWDEEGAWRIEWDCTDASLLPNPNDNQ